MLCSNIELSTVNINIIDITMSPVNRDVRILSNTLALQESIDIARLFSQQIVTIKMMKRKSLLRMLPSPTQHPSPLNPYHATAPESLVKIKYNDKFVNFNAIDLPSNDEIKEDFNSKMYPTDVQRKYVFLFGVFEADVGRPAS